MQAEASKRRQSEEATPEPSASLSEMPPLLQAPSRGMSAERSEEAEAPAEDPMASKLAGTLQHSIGACGQGPLLT